jgi:ATP-binding cassette subfamily F protein 3
MDRLDAVVSEKHGGSFGLKKVERTGNNVLTLEEISIGYRDKSLAKGIDLSLHRGEVLGIIGGNGSGKTTMLKTILGEIPALDGEIRWGTKTNFGYYAQNLEELEPRNDVINELRRVAPLADNGTLRSFLARFLFFGEEVFKLVGDLSGGEKGRLALAKLIYSQKNVLILDEPTNHLDIPAREALEAALSEYDGTIITVSHDRFFLDKVATQILAFGDDGVEVFSGNYTEYHEWDQERLRTSPTSRNSAPERTDNAPKSSQGGLSKNQIERIERRIGEIERSIPDLEARLEELSKELSSSATVTDPARSAKATAEVEALQAEIEELYSEWDTLAGKI